MRKKLMQHLEARARFLAAGEMFNRGRQASQPHLTNSVKRWLLNHVTLLPSTCHARKQLAEIQIYEISTAMTYQSFSYHSEYKFR